MASDKNLESIRHSLAHILAAAVLKKYPTTKLGIGPAIENGFYYDFQFKKVPNENILKELEKEMRTIIQHHLSFTGKKLTPAIAKKQFTKQPFKLDLIKEFVRDDKSLTMYSTGNIFTDLCRGGHVKNTKEINPDAFTLTHMAGAYWRGNEKNPQLTRIYGLAFTNKEELKAHLHMLEEARKRDHKKLGTALDLFLFSDLVGSGLPLFTPKGTIVRDLLDTFVWELRKLRGYERVDIPHITKKELYEKSGHWDKFREELFRITTRENHEFALKPMNCPHHTQIYNRKKWSYRELPQRYASSTKVYRDEQSGELAGIDRVRSITQDDAHVFCRKDQIDHEMRAIWSIIDVFYETFGFPLKVHLSLRDPKEAKKYLGSPRVWNESEKIVKQITEKHLGKTAFRKNVTIKLGEAAFYGPKIDFIAKDSLGRSSQVATIQLDLNMPERFNLTCINEKGKPERIFMVHAAIMGSIERFMAALIEHTAGKLPVWLSPVQVRILPISEKFMDYANALQNVLSEKEVRAELPFPNETLGKRIRESELQKIPYTLIVGEKEKSAKTVSVRHFKSGDIGVMPVENFLAKITDEIRKKTF
jgi:threonyl-tRNA synthetase